MKRLLTVCFLLICCVRCQNECPQKYKKIARKMDRLNELMAKYTCKLEEKKTIADVTTTVSTTFKTSTTSTPTTTTARRWSTTLAACGAKDFFSPTPSKAANNVFCVIKPSSFWQNGFTYEDIDGRLCTHIVIAFSLKVAENKDYELRLLEEIGPVEKIINYCKVYDMKVLLEIGSFENQNYSPKQFSRMAKNKTTREFFVNNTLALLQKYDLDGIFIRWLYPVCWFLVCTSGPGSDKPNFSALLRYMNKVIRAEGKLVVVDAPSNNFVIKTVFELDEVLQNIDYLVIYTCEYSGDWSASTSITAPYKNFANTVQTYMKLTQMNSSKLMATITSEITPMKLAKAESTRIGSFIRGRGSTNMDSYVKVCQGVRNGGGFVKASDDDNYAYAYKDGTWASYDSVELIRQKMAFLNTYEKFGGVVFRYLSDDDFNGTVCNSGKYPMLRTINEEIRGERVPVNSFP